jgi:hypothetical protein
MYKAQNHFGRKHMFGLKSFFSKPEVSAATDIPTPEMPKTKGKQLTLPSFITTAKPSTTSALQRTDRNLANTDLTNYRSGSDSRVVVRDFVRSSADLSAVVSAYVRTGITDNYIAVAKNPDGSFNPEATSSLRQIITRMDVLSDYSIGYDDTYSLRALSETYAREILMYGGCSGELVLDKARLPWKVQPISMPQVKFYPSADGRRVVPFQEMSGNKISLDIPTFFMVILDRETLEPYSVSPLEPSIQATLFSAEFLNDIRRIVKKAIHPRVVVTIDEDKFRKFLPPEYSNDADKLHEYMGSVISDIEARINGLKPEDALVVFDTLGIEIADHGNTNLSNEYKVVQDMINAQTSSGAKALPTILGHSNGTSNTASAEVLLFMKSVNGTITAKLNEMFSKMFTLAVRLLGHDVYVEFKFEPIDLRPDNELEAFRAMKQSRVLELLSLGLIGDEEACVTLTGHLPPQGYKPLTGTGFRPNTGAEPAGNGYNGASNDGSTMNQNLKSDAPKNPKSQNGGKTGNKQ